MTPPKNLGEVGELLLKAKALQCMQLGEIIPSISDQISSLHVGDFRSRRGTYLTRASCPSVGNLSELLNLSYKQLKEKLAYAGVVKAGTSMKADIQIN
jgi:hypothetical protein